MIRIVLTWTSALFLLLLAACGAPPQDGAPVDSASIEDCFADGTLSDFPWPPPQYSVAQTVPRAIVFGEADPTGASLEDVAVRLEVGLDTAGYIERAFYGIGCDGFAIVTRLEQIDSEGSPIEGAERFDPVDADQPFSLSSYVAQLFYAPPGFYRQITFVVTPRAISGDGSRVTEEDLDTLIEEGADDLPDSFGRAPFTPRHDVTALVYEFRATGNQDAEAIIPGRLPGSSHLDVSGISAALTRAGGG